MYDHYTCNDVDIIMNIMLQTMFVFFLRFMNQLTHFLPLHIRAGFEFGLCIFMLVLVSMNSF